MSDILDRVLFASEPDPPRLSRREQLEQWALARFKVAAVKVIRWRERLTARLVSRKGR